jgi:MoaA/NifB/PqqE/SkfB family radical SAM enzyme
MAGVDGRRTIEVTAARPEWSACLAPSVQLHLGPEGRVDACCLANRPLGRIGDEGLLAIWRGDAVAELRDRLAGHDYSMGCFACESEIALEGRPGSSPAQYDRYGPEVDAVDGALAWPQKIDFMLSNNCNLQCVQCTGEYSSAIRTHREGRPPLESPYDDRFFDDIRAFLPHLREATFEGGEPFLSNLNFRLWDLIAELNPGIDCRVTTNATHVTPRVIRVMETLQMGVLVSIDGATAATYEAIRPGASFDQVLANTRRLFAIAAAKGLCTELNHCMLPTNHREFGDVLELGDELGAPVNVSVVRYPYEHSIHHLPQDQIRAIADGFAAEDEVRRSRLGLNLATWIRETERVRRWAEASEADLDRSRHASILDFPTRGTAATDVEQFRREVEDEAGDLVVHELTVGHRNVVLDCSPSLLEVLRAGPSELVGQHVSRFGELVVERLGDLSPVSAEVGADTSAYVNAVGPYLGRTRAIAERGPDGAASQVRMFVTLDPAGHPASSDR